MTDHIPDAAAPATEDSCRLPTSCACASSQTTEPPSFVYAIGTISPLAPTTAVERELFHVSREAASQGPLDRTTLHEALSQRENRYLLRHLTWLLHVAGVPAYAIVPRDVGDFDVLLSCLSPAIHETALNVVVGVLSRKAPIHRAGGVDVPVVFFDQIYTFTSAEFIKALPRPHGADARTFSRVAADVMSKVLQIASNEGLSDSNRAMNYVATRYPGLYSLAAEMAGKSYAITRIEARPLGIGDARRLANVVVGFTSRTTDLVEKYFVTVDVTEEFPFLASKLQPYIDR
jgi:hypothetical protein